MTSIISAILVILAASLSAIVLKKEKQVRSTSVALASVAVVLIFSAVLPVLFGTASTWSNNLFLVDKFSALIASLVSFVYITATIVSFRYIGHEHEEKILSRSELKMFFALLHVFVLCMLMTVLTNNALMLWMALEGTTLSTTFLVGIYRKKSSVEAAWKYIIICSTGISLGLLGILLFGYSSSLAGIGGSDIFLLTSLASNANLLSADIVRWAFIFIFIGFGAKMGLVPMHIWLPDAHSKAPSPISGLFSGILLNVALYGIIRFRFITDSALGDSSWSSHLFLAFGVLSVLLPAFMMLVQNNYKRMLAYSSVEHMGLMSFALSLSPIGAAAAVIHMIGHTLAKSMLFFGAGEILLNYKTTQTARIKGMLKSLPYTSVLFLLGILAIIALPPSILFVSEYTMFTQAFAVHPVISLFVFAALSIIAWAMLKSTIGMFFKAEECEIVVKKEKWAITHSIMVLQLVLIVGLTLFVTTDSGVKFIDSIAKNNIYISK